MESKALVKWGFIELKCGLCGEDMIVTQKDYGCLYTCAEYPKCHNRMNTGIYEMVLEKIAILIGDQPDTNFTGYKWRYRTAYHHYEFRVNKHYPEKIVIDVVNVKQGKTPYQ